KSSVEQAEQASEALTHIAGAVDTISSMNTLIATAAEEQSQVADDIDQRIVSISDVAEQTRSDSQLVVSATQQIQSEVHDLDQLISRFKTR
ncbi:MAG: methyl-accepting chemotaxis protein, partial [Oceanospirillum sp.]|nr:methyl-accepting chemotaxis protein [Oceanospirillum sp.]